MIQVQPVKRRIINIIVEISSINQVFEQQITGNVDYLLIFKGFKIHPSWKSLPAGNGFLFIN